MKRADLEVGKEYWYSRSTRWDEYLYEGTKVVVVDAGYWTQQRGTWSRANYEPIRVSKGLGVLVDMTVRSYSGGEERVVRQVISVTTIRGLYEETKKKIEDSTEARTKQQREAREVSDRRDAEVKEVAALAKKYGISVVPRGNGNNTVTITAADLTTLINAAYPNL